MNTNAKTVNTPVVPQTRLIPVPDWPDFHSWPSVAGLRNLIFHAEKNGFSSAFKRVGRRVLVDEHEFFACVNRAQSGR